MDIEKNYVVYDMKKYLLMISQDQLRLCFYCSCGNILSDSRIQIVLLYIWICLEFLQ